MRRFIPMASRLLRPLCVSVLMCLVSGLALAQPAGPDCNRPYTLALHDHGLLYSAATDTGIDKDFADELRRRSGCTILVSLMSRARIWQLIETGALDFSLSGIATQERLRYATFAWYFSNKYYLLLRKDTGLHSLDEFKRSEHVQVGVIRGFRYSPSANALVDTFSANNRLIQAGALDPLYEALLANRIEAMIMEPFDYPIVQQKQIRAVTEIVEFNDPAVPHGMIMSNTSLSPVQRERWRALVKRMRADGTILRIFEKYFPPLQAAAMVQFQAPE